MIKAVIFDSFGVLAGSAYKEIYRLAGGDLDKDRAFLENILATANSGYMSADEMNKRVSERLGLTPAAWRERVRRGELPNQQLFMYVADIRTKGLKTAILSNASKGTMEQTFTPKQLAHFDEVVLSAEVHMMKPNPGIYELTAERLGVKTGECAFTDDNPTNVRAAEAVGMKGIVYHDLIDFKVELESLVSYLQG